MKAEEAIKEFRERIEFGKKEYFKHIPEYIEALEMAVEALEEVEQYRALGTVEELKEAKEKQIPKKPQEGDDTDLWRSGTYSCSICGFAVGFEDYKDNYCGKCGQAIDWSEE